MDNIDRHRYDRHHYASFPRHPLVVCGTLVQNPANLGGLCRTAEVFRLEGLVLADLAIAHQREFKNLAASAHHWQPLLTCPPGHLLEWMTAQQARGYALIALHTDKSAIPLDQFPFPHQSVLMLGQELTGLPPKIVNHCNHCVTISQYGMVESLNVQTAAAIAIYEYVRQHPLPR